MSKIIYSVRISFSNVNGDGWITVLVEVEEASYFDAAASRKVFEAAISEFFKDGGRGMVTDIHASRHEGDFVSLVR